MSGHPLLIRSHWKQAGWQRHKSILTRIGSLLVVAFCLAVTACTRGTTPPGTLNEPLPEVLPSPENSPTLDRIRTRGKILIGVKFDVPLFGFADPTTGELSGFDIEIGKAIAKDLFPDATDSKSVVEFVEALSKNREKFLKEHTVDLVISTYTINDARKQLVDFAGPYYVAGQDILARTEDVRSGRIRGIGDVNGRKVCSVTGSTSLANLRAAAPKANTSITKDKYSECFAALQKGQVDAMTTDDVILLGLAQNSPEFMVTGNPFHTEPYGIGIEKGDFEMRMLVNRVLREMANDGRWAKAFQQTVGTVGALAPTPPELDAQ